MDVFGALRKSWRKPLQTNGEWSVDDTQGQAVRVRVRVMLGIGIVSTGLVVDYIFHFTSHPRYFFSFELLEILI